MSPQRDGQTTKKERQGYSANGPWKAEMSNQTFQCNDFNIIGTISEVLSRYYFVELLRVSLQLNTIFEFLSASTFPSVCASAYPPPPPPPSPPPTATLFSEQSSRSRQSAERKLEPGQRELFVNKLEAVSSSQGCCAMLSIAGHDFIIFVNKIFHHPLKLLLIIKQEVTFIVIQWP